MSAVLRSRSTELDENVLRRWAGYRAWRIQVEASVESSVMVVWPRGANISIPQMRWLSVALATRFETIENSELPFGNRRGCYNSGWTGDTNDTSGVRRA